MKLFMVLAIVFGIGYAAINAGGEAIEKVRVQSDRAAHVLVMMESN